MCKDLHLSMYGDILGCGVVCLICPACIHCSGKTVDEVWQAIHAAQNAGAGASAPLPASYESIPLGRLLESMGIMSMEGLGLQVGGVPSYLPPLEPGALRPPQHTPVLTLPDPQVSSCARAVCNLDCPDAFMSVVFRDLGCARNGRIRCGFR